MWGCKSNEISLAQTILTIPVVYIRGCMWPDLMASKPDSVGALVYHWTDRTGRPLEPQVHWDATGTILADASTQWCPSGDPVLICIIGAHWKTTGRTLETHWLPTIISPVAFQCTLGSKFEAHWIATELLLAQGKGNIISVVPRMHRYMYRQLIPWYMRSGLIYFNCIDCFDSALIFRQQSDPETYGWYLPVHPKERHWQRE